MGTFGVFISILYDPNLEYFQNNKTTPEYFVVVRISQCIILNALSLEILFSSISFEWMYPIVIALKYCDDVYVILYRTMIVSLNFHCCVCAIKIIITNVNHLHSQSVSHTHIVCVCVCWLLCEQNPLTRTGTTTTTTKLYNE